MVQDLFELSSHAVRNAVVDGQLLNASHLPLHLRTWLFELFRMKRLLHNGNVLVLLGKPAFFAGFKSISMDDSDGAVCTSSELRSGSLCFMTLLETVLGANRGLAEQVAELSLSFAEDCCCPLSEQQPTCRRMESAGNLLWYCRNLQRLRLITNGLWNIGELSAPRDFSNIADIALPRLKHLSLIDHNVGARLDQYPKRWFASIQTLELHGIYYYRDAYSEVLTSCQNTLISLGIVGDYYGFCSDSPVPVRLPELKSLSVNFYQQRRTYFEEIVENCPNLVAGRFRLDFYEISPAELTALAQLSSRLQLEIMLQEGKFNFVEMIQVAGESVFGFFSYSEAIQFTAEDYDSILSKCTNLCSINITLIDDPTQTFLQKLFEDREKAARLIEVDLSGDPSATVLQHLFENCCNLRTLKLDLDRTELDINANLELWLRNGARPVSIRLAGFVDVQPEIVYELMKVSGRKLKDIDMGTRIADASAYETYLNNATNCSPFMNSCSEPFPPASNRGTKALMLLCDKYDRICFNSYIFDEIRRSIRTQVTYFAFLR